MVLVDLLVLQEQQDQPDLPDQVVIQDPQVLVGLPDLQDLLVMMGPLVLVGLQAHQVQLVIQDLLDPLVQREQTVQTVLPSVMRLQAQQRGLCFLLVLTGGVAVSLLKTTQTCFGMTATNASALGRMSQIRCYTLRMAT